MNEPGSNFKPAASGWAGSISAAPAAEHDHDHAGCCHNHFADFNASADLLSSKEKRSLGMRLALALICVGLLLIALVIRFVLPEQSDLAHLVAGVAAVLVAIPVLGEAWRSLRQPSLHGVTDQLVAMALIAAWVVNNFVQNELEIPCRDETEEVSIPRALAALSLWFVTLLAIIPLQ